ncbi:MAG: ABC transporter transmembrane domain-containing protein, partial [Paracoccaceae bacterium]|nr:ABC transporter transmembrane domain-containing protein [Paracoccaceae bacterium]
MIDRPLVFRTVRGDGRAGSGRSLPLLRLTADLRINAAEARMDAPPTPEVADAPTTAEAADKATMQATATPESPPEDTPAPDTASRDTAAEGPAPDRNATVAEADPARMKAFRDDNAASLSAVTIEGKTGGPVMAGPARPGAGQGGGGNDGAKFHKRMGPEDFQQSLKLGIRTVWRNLSMVMLMTCATNVLILAIPIYLFQISDRVLTSRSTDTLIMLTLVIVGAVVLQSMFDAVRRFMLMRTAVEVAARLGAPVLSAAAAASLNGSGREYQTLGDLQQLRGFLVSGTLISFLDVPFAPLFILVIFMIHPHLGMIVVVTALLLLVVALVNQRITAKPFAEANLAQAKANMHLDSMSRNSQIINAMAMIPEAVTIWGRDTAASLIAQVRAQDRNIISASVSRAVRMLTQVGMLGWGAYLAIDGQITGGMVIAASIVAGRALAPIEGSIEGWNAFILSRAAYGRVAALLRGSRLQFERLWLPRPEGRLNVERLLYVPGGTKQVILNGISFALEPGDSLAVIGNSGAGKTT